MERWRIHVSGTVQGVGFRPFVYRQAGEFNLVGWVMNSSSGVILEVQGAATDLKGFKASLEKEKPASSEIDRIGSKSISVLADEAGFCIRESDDHGMKTTSILPDLATCDRCIDEIFNPSDRRYLYPFTNCTGCGPRFSIILSLPYDRPNTTMESFRMCDRCRSEYENPSDRRFHAQPNACPDCGPQLEFRNSAGRVFEYRHSAMLTACEAIRSGAVVAVKGLGGFHLIADARNPVSVKYLRKRKNREEKPFALMFPDLKTVKKVCAVSQEEEELLTSQASPIVLLEKRNLSATEIEISDLIAPGNPYLGAMLPYTPLHHIMLRELGFPVVATSGNLTDEPICTDENEALERLSGIPDYYLVHNRPIARHVDDSIVRIMGGREMVTRRARGYAPRPIQLKAEQANAVAVGAHLKNTIAISVGRKVYISQHIGDLETREAYNAFKEAVGHLTELYETPPERIACDKHPDYLSSRYAHEEFKENVTEVQHHEAHVYSCLAEHGIEEEVLGVSWDGTGYGDDGTVWGGEFFRGSIDGGFNRLASFRQFRLPGGDKAVREPRRSALGLLYELYGATVRGFTDLEFLNSFEKEAFSNLLVMLTNRINCPLTSSAGRLFDAVSAITGIRQFTKYEGQAAMELEFAMEGLKSDDCYKMDLKNRTSGKEQLYIIDYGKAIDAIVEDVRKRVDRSLISVKFHNALAESVLDVIKLTGLRKVVLTGGVFQNRYLTERCIERLKDEGFEPIWHRRVPPNDGGISLGQIAALNSQRS